MTTNLKLYAIFSILWSIGFFYALNWGTSASEERWPYIVISAITYGLGFAIVGFLLGKSDDQSKVRYSLSAAYSATSNIVSAIIGSIWIVFFKPQDRWTLAVYLPIIAIVAYIGYLTYKKSIKGMDNKELFK